MERFRIHRTDVPRHAFLQQDVVRAQGGFRRKRCGIVGPKSACDSAKSVMPL